MVRINTQTLKIDKKEIEISKPKINKFSFYNKTIGAYQETTPKFVPRFSYSDQLKLFNAKDGSKIRKVK